jgi:hypothetical protein
MSWRDLVFALGGVAFSIALLPTVFGEMKPEPWTSALTSGILFAFGTTYLTMRLFFAAASTAVTAYLWLVLFVQAVMRG